MLQSVPVLPVFMALAFVTWLLGQEKSLDAPQYILLPLQTILMFLSVLKTGWVGGAIGVLSEFVPIVILFFMLSTSLDSIKRFKLIFAVLGISALIMSIHGIFQAAEGVGWTGATLVDGRIAYVGFLADPNDLSMSLLMTIPLVLYLANGSGFIWRWAWRALVVTVLYAIYLANSRGAMLAFGAMLLLHGLARFGPWRTALVLPVFLGAAMALGPSRMAEISSEEESAAGRLDAWYQGFQMLQSNPFLGVGKGLFTEYHHLTAHSSYVLALAELGLFGYFVWIAGIVLSLRMGLMVWGRFFKLAGEMSVEPKIPIHQIEAVSSVYPSEQIEQIRGIGAALTYSMVAMLVCAFFLSRSYTPIIYVTCAMVVAAHRLALKGSVLKVPVTFQNTRGAIIFFYGASIVILWLGTRILI